MRTLSRYFLLVFIYFISGQASATLIGDTVDWRVENCCGDTVLTNTSLVVEGASEFFWDQGKFTVTSDIEESSIHVLIEGSGFDALTIVNFWEDLDWSNSPAASITNVAGIESSSGVTGSGILGFGDDWVSLQTFINVDRNGFSYDMWIDLETTQSASEPATFALLSVALVGLGFVRRKNNRPENFFL